MRTLPLLAALAVIPLAALAQEVRTGADAYGDWRSDAPGVERRIDLAALPAPYATSSAGNRPSVVRRPDDALPRVPDGFTVQLWASGLDRPRVVRRAPDGTMFLAESGGGRIRAWRENGAPPRLETFADGLEQPFGIAFWPPAAPRFVYVAETNRVVRYPWQPGTLRPAGHAELVVPDLPTGGHWTRDLAVSPDGARIYLSVGSAGNMATDMSGDPPGGVEAWQRAHGLGAAWAENTGRADVLWFDPNEPRPALHPYANGVRNCSGLAIQPGSGTVWCATNERDGLGDDLPPDYATSVRAGAFYGWPWFYVGDHPDPRMKPRADLADKVTVPDVPIQPHSAPLGITFYDGSAFPAQYRGDAFVALHGSWNRAKRTGYKVIRLLMHDGKPTGLYEDFLTGLVVDNDDVWGRPVDVAVAPDGALLVTEDGNGTIWRVTRTGG